MSQKRYAFLIGANGPTLNPLQFAQCDAKRLKEAFSSGPCTFTDAAWTVAANARTTLSDLETFTNQCGPLDLLVVHFSGHAYHSRGHLYLLCNDTDTGRLVSSALNIQSIKDVLQNCRASHKLLTLDCCHAGAALPDGFKGSQEIESILQEVWQGSGSAILAACSSSKRARELAMLDGGAGFLSWALASACTTHFKDASPDGVALSLTEAWQRGILPLHKEVNQKLSKDEQLPPPHSWHKQEGDGEIWLTEARRETSVKGNHGQPSYDREHFLKVLLADHSSFMQDRLSSFVGRTQELQDIQQRIAEKQPTGGYVMITGQAGQGKSSIIAKLVQEYGCENVAFHFIPFNPGPDHQVGLLRNLMACLILKYDLSDLYVASDSRPALRDYFPKVLKEVAAKRGREVIFIDGLDQLEEDATGVRDLTFLPPEPPEGVVFVLGTRPNDTLRPLELLKPRYEYQLPDLSREDFDLILLHHHIQLDEGRADRLYTAIQGNALYLDLLAKELESGTTAPDEALIEQLADDPQHLFSLPMNRFKRQPTEWREVIKPVLGVLLVTREPLSVRHMRQILGIEDDRLRDGIERLGGLITRDWQHRYFLFHLKLFEFLRQNDQCPTKDYIFATDEEESWHKRVAQWCEGKNLSTIWQDVEHDATEQRRREYARQHYLTHLFAAHDWQRLFEVLDTIDYGKAKIQNDPSTRSYTDDLDLGRQAATWNGWTLEESIALLPRLWRYTLLRCSLTSRADQYPLVAFGALVLLNRKQQALGLAELLTNSVKKVDALLEIAKQLQAQSGQEREWLALLLRAGEIVNTIESSKERAWALAELASGFVQAQQWERAQSVITMIEDSKERAVALGKLATAFAQAQEWERAQAVWAEAQGVTTIEDSKERAVALGKLATAFVQAEQWERAQGVWDRAQGVINTIEDSNWRAWALAELASGLVQAQQWERAQDVINTIEDNIWRAKALVELASAFVQAEQWERAQAVWAETQGVINMIEDSKERAKALVELASAFVQAEQWECAQAVWAETQDVINTIEDSRRRAVALGDLASALAQSQQWERAQAVWAETQGVINTIENSYWRAVALGNLASAFAQAQQWERAQGVINTIEVSNRRAKALGDLATAMVTAGKHEQVVRLIQRWWCLASTRKEALELFPLATHFIPRNPELGAALYEAFAWVDSFLKG